MVNTLDFAKRLEKILKEYDLSAATFAQKIKVGRATISHILSGRNKPSLDFVLKIINTFPEVDLYWLLNGKGSFPKIPNIPLPDRKPDLSMASLKNLPPKKISNVLPETQDRIKKDIDKIIIFYNDGSFESYSN